MSPTYPIFFYNKAITNLLWRLSVGYKYMLKCKVACQCLTHLLFIYVDFKSCLMLCHWLLHGFVVPTECQVCSTQWMRIFTCPNFFIFYSWKYNFRLRQNVYALISFDFTCAKRPSEMQADELGFFLEEGNSQLPIFENGTGSQSYCSLWALDNW